MRVAYQNALFQIRPEGLPEGGYGVAAALQDGFVDAVIKRCGGGACSDDRQGEEHPECAENQEIAELGEDVP